MKIAFGPLPLIPLLLVSVGAMAQEAADSEICERLISLNHAGLYISYPGGVPGERLREARGSMPYDPNARFYFVPGFGPRLTRSQDEGVWHIRTQSQSVVRRGTDTALVYRPAFSTRCDPQGLLAFNENDRFIPLLSYQRHHATLESERRPSTALSQGFHFQIRDRLSSQANGCSPTDDRQAFPDLAALYGFDSQGENALANALTIVRPVYATVKSAAYDGLSSEFAYDRGDGTKPACFGFTMALPTNGLSKDGSFFGPSNLELARRAGQVWRPMSTSLVIKRLRGRTLLNVYNKTVLWGG
jgi:hypothetical protein